MASTFLNQLRRISISVLAEEDQNCSICFEDYGTTPSDNGIIEHAVRLPCGHTVGSECIAKWVSTSDSANTCHLCRHVLFQNQSPRQAEDERIPSELVHYCIIICEQLAFTTPNTARLVAMCIASGMHTLRRVEERNVHAVATASVYMASHLLEDARSLELVAGCVHDVGIEGVRSAYNMLYCHRRDLFDGRLLALVPAGAEAGWLDRTLPSVYL